MVRTVIGGLVAGLVLFFVGFVFWGTPLAEMAYSNTGQIESAAIQQTLAQHLTPGGTGTYVIPNPNTAEGTVLYGKGPVAQVFFNTGGFPVEDMSMMVTGLVFAAIAGLLISFGLAAVGGGGRSFAGVAGLVVLFSLGITVWTVLAQPVFNHYGWGYWIYSFFAETIALILAGLVVAKWFLPRYERPAAEGPPTGA